MSIGPSGIGSGSEMGSPGAGRNYEQEELDEKLSRLDYLRTKNQQTLTGMRANGADMSPLAVFQTRLTTLTDMLFPDGTMDRLNLEISFEDQISTLLAQAESEVARAKLAVDPAVLANGKLAGGSPSNGGFWTPGS